MALSSALFLDRDGVIIENVPYVASLASVRILAGATDAIRRVNDAGVPVVVVTNQSGVARGLFPESFVVDTHDFLDELLARDGAHIDAWYYCSHHPEGKVTAYRLDCRCRKPNPGMLLVAAREHHLDLCRSWLIGDSIRDCQAGAAAGCRTILLGREHAELLDAEERSRLKLEAVVATLSDAVAMFREPLTSLDMA